MQITPVLLSGLGLIALASSTSVKTGNPSSVAAPITFWQDTQTQKHHCDGRDIIRCETPRAKVGGTCITIDTCESFCFIHDNGAACVNIGAPPMPKIPVSAKVTARAASSEENEHNECSKDRTGVRSASTASARQTTTARPARNAKTDPSPARPSPHLWQRPSTKLATCFPRLRLQLLSPTITHPTHAPGIAPACSSVSTVSAPPNTTAQRDIHASTTLLAARRC
jgi:hypothetical protein